MRRGGKLHKDAVIVSGSQFTIEGFGLQIVERVPLEIAPSNTTRKYLEAKKTKLGHILDSIVATEDAPSPDNEEV